MIYNRRVEAEFTSLDIIETTQPVLNCLVEDMKHDPEDKELPHAGLALFSPDGTFQNLIWG